MTSTQRRASRPGVAAFLSAALLLGCPGERSEVSPEEPVTVKPARILLFAVDGLEWSLVLPLVQRGELPTFAALMERGVFGTLRTFEPALSPIIWTTVATGKLPRRHGITGFVYDVPGPNGPRQRLFSSGDRKTKAFWNMLSDAGLSVDVVGWWITYPAEPVRGLMVSQTNTSAALGDDPSRLIKGSLQPDVEGQVWPREKAAEVLATLREMDAELPAILREAYGERPHPLGELEQRLWDESLWSFRADETYLRVALDRLREPPARLTALYMGAPDVVGHRFWRYAFPEQFDDRPAREQVENFGDLLAATYRRADRALAALLERMPADVTVWVMSDHGMQARNTGARFSAANARRQRSSGTHVPRALLIAAGPGIRRAGVPAQEIASLELGDLPELGSVLDTTPTLLAMLGLAVGDDMDGRPITEVIQPAWLAENPVRSIPSWDTGDWATAREALRVQQPGDEERLEQLRSLGYIE